MKKQIFIINGSGGCGKDTFISFVSDEAENPIMNFSSIDKVKEIAKIIGWNGKKTEKDRKFLSDLKILCTAYNNMPFNSMRNKVTEFNNNNAEILFLHIREPEEIDKAKTAFGAKTILIKRNDIKHIVSNMADRNVFNYKYDIVVNNDSDLDSFKNKAITFFRDFKDNQIKTDY